MDTTLRDALRRAESEFNEETLSHVLMQAYRSDNTLYVATLDGGVSKLFKLSNPHPSYAVMQATRRRGYAEWNCFLSDPKQFRNLGDVVSASNSGKVRMLLVSKPCYESVYTPDHIAQLLGVQW